MRPAELEPMTDLLASTAELVGIPSVSHDEGVLADLVEARLEACDWLKTERVGDNVVARTSLGRDQRLVLAGHLDTVPPRGQRRRPGRRRHAVGSRRLGHEGRSGRHAGPGHDHAEPIGRDLTWCFYAREEIGRDQSGLLELWSARPDLLAGDAAILGEPTAGLVEAGCQGTMRLKISLRGVRAHTARPFTGRNAIHRLGAGAPTRGRLGGSHGRARRLRLRRAAPGGGRRWRSGRQRRPRRGQRDVELSLRPRS